MRLERRSTLLENWLLGTSRVQGKPGLIIRRKVSSDRASGQLCMQLAVCGGGLLSEVPGFKELDKCGKSLGDVIGGGDEESARKRWTEEYVKEIQEMGKKIAILYYTV